MATVTRLIVQVGADTNNLRQNLDRGLGYLRQFAKTTADIGNRSNIFGAINPATARTTAEAAERVAKQAAERSFRAVNQTYVNGINNLREQLVRGNIGQDEFAKQARVLGQTFNRSLVTELDNLAAAGLLTERVRAGMMAQFKDLGDEAGKALRERLIQGIQLEQDIGRKLTTGLTLPIVAGFTLAAKSAADFENNMLRVGSLLDATVPEFRALENAARDFSSVVSFGIVPSEAAKGMQILAQAGFSVREVMDILPTSLKLAAVEQTDLANATNIATSVMTAFRIESGGAAAAADVLAKASIESKASLTDLGFSFTYVGGVARSVGLQFHETATALSLMAEEGFRGTLAGTALRGAILKLTSPTKEQADILRKLKVETVDASGKMLSLASIIKQFEDAEKTFGAFRVGADILKLFGQRAGPGFGALIRQGSEAFAEFQTRLENSAGTLDRIARAQVSGLTGAFKQLISSLQVLAIAITKSGLLEWLTAVIRQITKFVQSISELSPAVLKTVTVIGLLLALFGPIVSAVAAAKLAIVGFGAAGVGLGAILAPSAAILTGLAALATALILINQYLHRGEEGLADYRSALGLLNQEQALNQKIFEAKRLAELQQQQIGLSRAMREEARRARMIKTPQGMFPVPTQRFKDLDRQFRENAVTIVGYKKRIEALNEVIKQQAGANATMKNAAKDAVDVMNQLIAEMEEGLFAGGNLANKKTILEILLEQMNLAAAKMQALKTLGQDTVGEGLLAGQRFGTAAVARELNTVGDIYSTILRLVKDKIALNKVELADLQALKEAADLYRKSLGLGDTMALKERLKIDIPLFDDAEITKKFGQLETLAQRIRELQTQQTLALNSRNQEQAALLQKRIEEDRRILAALRDALADLATGKNLSPAALQQIFDRIQTALSGTGVELETNAARQKRWNKAVDLTQKAFKGLSRVFRGLEGVDDIMRSSLDSINLVIEGVQQLKKAIADAKAAGKGGIDLAVALPGIAGVLGGVAGIVGGILGGDDEMKRIQRENNAQLERLRAQLSKTQFEGLGGQENIRRFLSQLDFGKRIKGFQTLDSGGSDAARALDKQARAFGLTLAQLELIADDFGIKLTDDGRLVAGSLKDLREALGISAEALRTFSLTMDNQRTLIETERKLRGVPDTPEIAVAEDLEILKKAAPLLFQFIGSITDVTAETAPALRESLLRLIASIKAGEISAEAFDKFGSADAFLEFLNSLADNILDLENATESASDALRNVPSVLKLDKIRFQSQFTEEMDKRFKEANKVTVETPAASFNTLATKLDALLESSPPDLISGLKSIHDAILTLSRDTDSTARDSTSNMGGTTVNITVDSSDLRSKQNASILADKVVEGMRRKSMTKFGTSVRIGGI